MKRLVLLLIVLFVVVAPAHGFNGFFRRPATTTSSSYYYAVPVYVVPTPMPYLAPALPLYPSQPGIPGAPTVPPMQPATGLPMTPPIVVPGPAPFANPSPAPPSLTPEPMESSTSLRVDTRYYDLFPTANGRGQGDKCSVAFWNLTGRTVTIRVDGQNRILTNGQSATVDVPRNFRWQVEGRGVENVQMASSDKGAEILIRR